MVSRYYLKFGILVVIGTLSATMNVWGEENISFVLAHTCTKPVPNNATQSLKAKTELGYLGFLMLNSYQRFIATQDKPVCIFSTSCSNFGMLAIEKKGFLKGTLLTADRLTRCNTQALHYYKTNPVNLRKYDPVITFFLK